MDNDGETILHFCSREGCVDFVTIIVRYIYDIDAVDNDGWTSLHWACQGNYFPYFYINIHNVMYVKVLSIALSTYYIKHLSKSEYLQRKRK